MPLFDDLSRHTKISVLMPPQLNEAVRQCEANRVQTFFAALDFAISLSRSHHQHAYFIPNTVQSPG